MRAGIPYFTIVSHFSDFVFPPHSLFVFHKICAKCAQWIIPYRPGRELILTGFPPLSYSNILQIIVVVVEFILSKLLHFENMETDPEMLSDLLKALQLVVKLGISLSKK